jgi:hypothetical protein
MMKIVILIAIILIAVFTTMPVFASAYSNTWGINKVVATKSGCVMEVIDKNDQHENVDLNARELAGLMKYVGVKNIQWLRWHRFSGNDLRTAIKHFVQWSESMSAENKRIEIAVDGILSFSDFNLPKGIKLDTGTIQRMNERISIRTKGKRRLTAAKDEDFSDKKPSKGSRKFAVRETNFLHGDIMTGRGRSDDREHMVECSHPFEINEGRVRFDAETVRHLH